ncbi:hypothetical protein R3W88_026273 [Solanum pinnatisectum]|uniref:Uncharacterized protein n=1 Tax=Solanum pinnatisectum TaxID=50273 RepID=A0AAV9LDQ6_9SOLN|nr:hypothetical protein R3W88_026273 [Solanum pinnatisectum]
MEIGANMEWSWGDLDAIKNGGSELLILVSTHRNDLLENVTFLNYLSKRVLFDIVKMLENRRKLKVLDQNLRFR